MGRRLLGRTPMVGDDPPTVHVRTERLEIWVHTLRGRVRQENQDAWSLVTPEGVWWGPRPGTPGDPVTPGTSGQVAVAVFDGVGGHPNGGEAARAAAQALASVIAGDQSKKGVLQGLDRAVRATGGATTAVVAFVGHEGDPMGLRVVAVGDSTAYRLDAHGQVERINERDRRGRNALTDALGAGPLAGHEDRPGFGAGFVLVTDGVDDVVPVGFWVRELLRSTARDVSSLLERLSGSIHEAGAPDNATLVVVQGSGRRRGRSPGDQIRRK